MDATPVELSDREAKALLSVTLAGMILTVGAWVLSAIDGFGWLLFVGIALLVITIGSQIVYLARSRGRSIGSVLAFFVPDRYQSSSQRVVGLTLVVAAAAFATGPLAGRGGYDGVVCGMFLAGILASSMLELLASRPPEPSEDAPDGYPFSIMMILTAVVLADAAADAFGDRPLAAWGAGVWGLPVGLLALAGQIRRWRMWSRAH